ncbi:hypothetical protein HYW66_02070 [Candidatus Microgenomates bacterium]|nr:hypothetical protein [Candidatus Microgenomates bacterium]
MNTLLIDTTSNKEIEVGLRINSKKYAVRQKIDKRRAQVVLPLIDKILRKNNVRLSDLNEIEVNTKEGSFTGIRVGLSIAQALSFTLKIPLKKVLY